MQIDFSMFTPSGRWVQNVRLESQEQADEVAAVSGNLMLPGFSSARHYRSADGTLDLIPDQPAVSFQWDWGRHEWLDSRTPDQQKADKSAEVNAERERRMVLPITVGGVTIDADPVSVGLLGDKAAVLQMRMAAGAAPTAETLVWRDAGNVTRSWPTAESYLAWLISAALEIEERATALYMASWAIKAALEQCSDPSAFDTTQGWPLAD